MFAATLRRKRWSLVTFELAASTCFPENRVALYKLQLYNKWATATLWFWIVFKHAGNMKSQILVDNPLSNSIFFLTIGATFCNDEPRMKLYNSLTFEVGEGRTPHDVPSVALFTQAAKASIRSLQPSAPFSAMLQNKQTEMRSQVRQCWLFSEI